MSRLDHAQVAYPNSKRMLVRMPEIKNVTGQGNGLNPFGSKTPGPKQKPGLVLIDHVSFDKVDSDRGIQSTFDAFKAAGVSDPSTEEIFAVLPFAYLLGSDEEMVKFVDTLLADQTAALNVAGRIGNGDATAADATRLFRVMSIQCRGRNCGDSISEEELSTGELIHLLDNTLMAANRALSDPAHRYNADATSVSQGDPIASCAGPNGGTVVAAEQKKEQEADVAAQLKADADAKAKRNLYLAGGALALSVLITGVLVARRRLGQRAVGDAGRPEGRLLGRLARGPRGLEIPLDRGGEREILPAALLQHLVGPLGDLGRIVEILDLPDMHGQFRRRDRDHGTDLAKDQHPRDDGFVHRIGADAEEGVRKIAQRGQEGVPRWLLAGLVAERFLHHPTLPDPPVTRHRRSAPCRLPSARYTIDVSDRRDRGLFDATQLGPPLGGGAQASAERLDRGRSRQRGAGAGAFPVVQEGLLVAQQGALVGQIGPRGRRDGPGGFDLVEQGDHASGGHAPWIAGRRVPVNGARGPATARSGRPDRR